MKRCTIKNCERTAHTRLYCQYHYDKLRRSGQIKTDLQLPRPAIIEKNIAKIPIGLNAKQGYALVDIDLAYLADKYKFHITTHGYVRGHDTVNKKDFGLARLIIKNIPKGLEVDHINRNKLDNRRSNLRIVTRSQNMHNTGLSKNNTTGAKGVYRAGSRYGAQVKIEKKTHYLGLFSTLKEASNAIDQFKANKLRSK